MQLKTVFVKLWTEVYLKISVLVGRKMSHEVTVRAHLGHDNFSCVERTISVRSQIDHFSVSGIGTGSKVPQKLMRNFFL